MMVDMRVVSMVVSWDQRRVVGKDVKMVIYLALSLAELMAETIRRIVRSDSVSSLFID